MKAEECIGGFIVKDNSEGEVESIARVVDADDLHLHCRGKYLRSAWDGDPFLMSFRQAFVFNKTLIKNRFFHSAEDLLAKFPQDQMVIALAMGELNI